MGKLSLLNIPITNNLTHNDIDTDTKEINKINVTELVSVVLIPQHTMSERDGNTYFKKIETYILSEMMKVIIENEEFYKNFIVERRFNGEGANLERRFGNQILINMDKRLHIDLKAN